MLPRIATALALLLPACSGGGGDSQTSASGSSGSSGSSGPASTTAASESSGPATSGSSGPATTSAATSTATTGDAGPVGLDLLPRLAGLWSGPATMTPLGDFFRMNMDFRAADGHVLFGRVDVDAANNLRFAFEIEDHGAGPTLVYRNGGYFLGVLRDSRTVLESHEGDTWRFCSAPKGCEYIDARFTFSADDHLVLQVDVKGKQHLTWDAKRVETRALPEPFPVDELPQATDAPFPAMPSLRVDVTWAQPLVQDGEVWAILTTQPCDAQFTCQQSRSLRVAAPAGASAATLVIDQIHAGDYLLTAILDRNGDLAQTLAPGPGDGVSIPNKAVTVAPRGESTASALIVVDL